MKTILFPQSIFGAATAYSAYLFEQPTANTYGALNFLLFRYPIALFWTWSNLLPFNIFNQLNEDALKEDRINKPWRPLPSGRLDQKQATLLMGTHYIIAVIVSSILGGLRQALLLILLGAWYNAWGGADKSFIIRNAINSVGILTFAFGAMEVSLGTPLVMTRPLLQWMGILASVILSTVQTQDLYDMEGDSSRNRKTMPLVVGDSSTRWWTAAIVLIFSVLCPAYWSLDWPSLVPLFLGVVIATRTLLYRTPEADKKTFWVWNAWLVSNYCLPLARFLILHCLG